MREVRRRRGKERRRRGEERREGGEGEEEVRGSRRKRE